MGLYLKPGVDVSGLQPSMLLAIMIVWGIYSNYGSDTTITSALDGEHSYGSLHYVGLATDFRTRHLSKSTITKLSSDISAALGSQYDVVIEPTHLHIEFQPKT